MGLYVKIRKLFEQKESEFLIHYYKVEGNNYSDGDCFYIGINPVLQVINFYKNEGLKKPIKIIDFRDTEAVIGHLEGVRQIIYGTVLLQVKRALMENRFPEYLDHCS